MREQCSDRGDLFEQMHEFVTARINDDLTPEQFARFNALLSENEAARRLYVQYIYETLALPALLGEVEPAAPPFGSFAEDVNLNDSASDQIENNQVSPAAPACAVEAPPCIIVRQTADSQPFVGGPVFSYMVASVFMCLLLLGFWAYKLPSDRGSSTATNENSRGLTGPGESFRDRPAPVFVGRVTGMAGAKWSDEPNYIAPIGIRVALGRQYKLKSGLLEITYDSGAKVILEGPCSYEVDSTAGGYLALGKLVARVESGGEGRGTGKVVSGQWSVTSMKDKGGRRKAEGDRPNAASLATSHSPLATNSSPLSPLPSPLFSVRTPTAVVTDLGTEFGVEVAVNGDTASHVFQGKVVVKAVIRGFGDSGIRDLEKRPATAVAEVEAEREIQLAAGQTARVAKDAKSGKMRLLSGEQADASAQAKFIRRIVGPPMVIDLLDIVAGGNGRGNRRERGIDPTTGSYEGMSAGRASYEGNHQYQLVTWNIFVDGVFIPDGGGNVQLDSASHEFSGFPKTSNRTYGSIWSRKSDAPNEDTLNPGTWLYAIGRPSELMPEGRGLLGMHANVGITFDLAAIREANRNMGLGGLFRAVAGVADARPVIPEADGSADLWIFVDGALKWNRLQLRPADGPIEVDLPLGPNDRFLTLAVTDGGRKICYPWAVFGDPVLELAPEDETLGK